MGVLWFWLLLWAALSAAAPVLELDDSSFDRAISASRYILVDFYAPWCGHCKAISPELDELASRIAGSSMEELVIAKVNADKFRRIASQYKIDAYPTLKLFENGAPTEYRGSYKADAMLPKLKRMMSQDIAHVKDDSALQEFMDSAGTHLPVFIGLDDGGLLKPELSKLAKAHKLRAWFVIVEADLDKRIAATYGLSKLPAVVAQHRDAEDRQILLHHQVENDLATFVRRNLQPPVTQLSPENLNFLKEDGRAILLVAVSEKAPASLKMLSQLKGLASMHAADFVFAVLDASSWSDFASTFHIDEATRLPRALIWTGSLEYYESDGDLDEDVVHQVVKLVHEYKDGSAKKLLTKRPSFPEQLMGFLGQNLLYIILFVVTTFFFLQNMDWKTGPPVQE